jgi:predicted transcriptional regulator
MALIKPYPLVADLNDRAFRAGIRISDMLRRAGVPQSTWTRWRDRRSSPRLETIERLDAALSAIEEEDHA